MEFGPAKVVKILQMREAFREPSGFSTGLKFRSRLTKADHVIMRDTVEIL